MPASHYRLVSGIMNQHDEFHRVRDWIGSASRISILTGAGISAESGIPTFRGSEGLWRKFRPEELASPEAFSRDPTLVWEWYDWRRKLVAEKSPNAGHFAIATLERNHGGVTLITQNVDGLHDRAGSVAPLRLHGDLWHLRCSRCQFRSINQDTPLDSIPPLCECGAILRPDIVWFGEMLPEDVLRQAWESAARSDLFLVVGTSALVQPAASLPLVAKEGGARLVEINLQTTPLSEYADISLLGPAGKVLPRLLPAG